MPGRRPYLLMMGTCLLLIVNAWTWVWLLSRTVAVVLSAVALAIPPFAAIVANAGREPSPGHGDDPDTEDDDRT